MTNQMNNGSFSVDELNMNLSAFLLSLCPNIEILVAEQSQHDTVRRGRIPSKQLSNTFIFEKWSISIVSYHVHDAGENNIKSILNRWRQTSDLIVRKTLLVSKNNGGVFILWTLLIGGDFARNEKKKRKYETQTTMDKKRTSFKTASRYAGSQRIYGQRIYKI